MIIRDLVPSDYADLSALFELSRNVSLPATQLARLAERGYELWRPRVLIYEDQFIGSCLLSRFETAAAGRYEVHVDVHPAFMRQGFGSQLYADAFDFVRALGLTSLYAYVRHNRAGGADFAHKKGFEIVREEIQAQLLLMLFMGEPFAHYVTECEAAGFRLVSLAELGDTAEQRYQLYELNKLCSLDIPGRGPFFSYEEYCQIRYGHPAFTPEGAFVAIEPEEGRWVGLSLASHHPEGRFLFNEMTGVLRNYRGRGLAMALKVKVIGYGRSVGVQMIRTYNDAANKPMLAVNQKLGYQVMGSTYRMEKQFGG